MRFTDETNAAKEACKHYQSTSYLLKHLVYHMRDMYSYGFTESEMSLPTPAVCISYISQLLLNIEYHTKKKHFIETNNEEQWGFTVDSESSYVDYEMSKRILIPFTFELVDDIDDESELLYVF